MKLEDVQAKLAEIQQLANAGDNEVAHEREDQLYVQVLEVVGAGRASQPATLAREALKAKAIRFERWYA